MTSEETTPTVSSFCLFKKIHHHQYISPKDFFKLQNLLHYSTTTRVEVVGLEDNSGFKINNSCNTTVCTTVHLKYGFPS